MQPPLEWIADDSFSRAFIAVHATAVCETRLRMRLQGLNHDLQKIMTICIVIVQIGNPRAASHLLEGIILGNRPMTAWRRFLFQVMETQSGIVERGDHFLGSIRGTVANNNHLPILKILSEHRPNASGKNVRTIIGAGDNAYEG